MKVTELTDTLREAYNEEIKTTIQPDLLIDALKEIIINARLGDTSGKKLRIEINKLNQLVGQGFRKNISVKRLYDIYSQIQTVSLELRHLLPQFINDDYDSIAYTFYYQGKRYTTEHLKLSWLYKESNNRNYLKLNLTKAIADIEQEMQGTYQEKVNAMFNQHYAKYEAAIIGTYRGTIGRGGAINMGHIAEAFEEHLAQHHKILYKIANTPGHLSVADQQIVQLELQNERMGRWDMEEDIESAWVHMRHAMGTQRGTVAGDVGRFQVKQGKVGQNKVRLASLNTLLDGTNIYSDILNPDKDVQSVAENLAKYLTEPSRKVATAIVNQMTQSNSEIGNYFIELNQAIDQVKGFHM